MGSHHLTLVVADSSGNESRAVQTVSVTAAHVQDFDSQTTTEDTPYTVPAKGAVWAKVTSGRPTNRNHIDIDLSNTGAAGMTATDGATKGAQSPSAH